MMKFLANHNSLIDGDGKQAFSDTFAPLMVALMQFTGAMATEMINILSICALSDTKEVIMNFIALGVIA
jgi:hypothetical protein